MIRILYFGCTAIVLKVRIYEGELFTFFMDLFSPWPNPAEREKVWEYKSDFLRQ